MDLHFYPIHLYPKLCDIAANIEFLAIHHILTILLLARRYKLSFVKKIIADDN